MKKQGILIAWATLFICLALFFQTYNKFHFFAVENSQLFLNSRDFIISGVSSVGGGASLLSGWIVQFFVLPYAGAILTALLLTLTGLVIFRLLNRMTRPGYLSFVLSIIPILFSGYLHFNANYFYQGTVSFLLALLLLTVITHIKRKNLRSFFGIVLPVALYLFAGPYAILYAGIFAIIEYFRKELKPYIYILPLVATLLVAFLSVKAGWVGEYRFAFLPDMYYHALLKPGILLYFPGALVIISIVLAGMLSTTEGKKRKKQQTIGWIFACVTVICLAYYGTAQENDRKNYRIKTFAHYARTGQWEKITAACKGIELRNYVEICYLNMALANEGKLAENLFDYDQHGAQGLVVSWNKSPDISSLLSAVYMTCGHIALAQEMAFEANIASTGNGSPEMYKRLIATNRIFKNDKVAEKYARLLKQTTFHADDADRLQRTTGGCLPDTLMLSLSNGMQDDLEIIATACPEYRKNALEYCGALYLLSHDLENFKHFLEKYAGTEMLPALPRSFQEAVLILSEKEPGIVNRYPLAEETVNRFKAFRQTVLANRNNSSRLPALLKSSFGNTYWYYFMFN